MIDRELLDQFLAEAREQVATASAALLAIEREGAAPGLVALAFRAVHTLKGGAAICGLAPLEQLLHAAEDLLDAVRAGHLAPAGAIAPLLDAVTLSETWLGTIETTGTLPPDAAQAASRLEPALRQHLGAAPPMPPAPGLAADALAALASRHADAVARAAGAALTAFRYTPDRDCFFRGEDPVALLRAIPGLVALDLQLAPGAAAATPFDPFRCHLVIEGLSRAEPAAVLAALGRAGAQVAVAPLATATLPAAAPPPRTLRVATARVDRLVDLAGELAQARTTLAGRVDAVAVLDPALGRALRSDLAAIERLAGTLHRSATALRLAPLAPLFRRLPLPVRETAAALGKDVRLITEGGETECDRAVADALFEPLLHLLRNAVGHGIEDAGHRRAAGKQATGTITLTAATDRQGLLITLEDDGRGMDPAALRRTASASGLADPATLAAMTDADALELVWTPGFSTATSVTGVAGRGVGMDAVRHAIEALGGRVSLASIPGRGTTVRLALPQAASLTPAMIVGLGSERFGVPVDAVAEAARIDRAAILPLGAGEAFVRRDRTVPLRPLATLLGLPTGRARGAAATALLLGDASGPQVAVEVDALLGRADLLLRPLPALLAGLPGLLGTAVEVDGTALLVLDLAALAAAA